MVRRVIVRLLRNATQRVSYGGLSWLWDPYLAPRFSRPSFAGASPNPLVELPCPPQEAVAGIDAVIMSHLHSDHFDPLACSLLTKGVPFFCQPWDREEIRGGGFTDVRPVEDSARQGEVTINRVPAVHGSGAVLGEVGRGLHLVRRSAPDDRALRPAGDHHALQRGGLGGRGADRHGRPANPAVCRTAPRSTVIAVHMEALDHGTVSRRQLRAEAEAAGVPEQLLRIPQDGEEIKLERN